MIGVAATPSVNVHANVPSAAITTWLSPATASSSSSGLRRTLSIISRRWLPFVVPE